MGLSVLLGLIDYFFSHVGEIFNNNLFKKFLTPFLFSSSSSGTPIIWMLLCLILSQMSLRLSSVLFIHFLLLWSSVFLPSNGEASVQFSSVAQQCLTLCDPMNCSMPGLPVHHQLPEFTQTHVHRVGDAIQPSHPLSSPSPPAPNPSQHQSLFR